MIACAASTEASGSLPPTNRTSGARSASFRDNAARRWIFITLHVEALLNQPQHPIVRRDRQRPPLCEASAMTAPEDATLRIESRVFRLSTASLETDKGSENAQ